MSALDLSNLPAVIARCLCRPARVDESTSLVESGLLDSFALVETIVALEREYGVKLRDADLVPANFETVAAIRRLLERAGDDRRRS